MEERDDLDTEVPSAEDDPVRGGPRPDNGSGASFAARHEIAYADEVKRKAIHLLALVIPLVVWLVGKQIGLALLVAAAALALGADVLRVRSELFARTLYRVFGIMMRPEECPPVGGRLVLNGATWVLLSASLLVALFPLDVAVLSFTVFMIADAAAALVGRRWGRRRWGRTTRTAEGSGAFFIAGVAVMGGFGWTPWWTTLAAVAAGAAAEVPSRPLNDNIRVPLVVAAVVVFCRLIA